MMTQPTSSESAKVQYSRMACLFLAEGLRTRRIQLKRAVDIVEKILQHINLMDTESDFLSLVKELSRDFEELAGLEAKMQLTKLSGERKKMETLAREYAIKLLPSDSARALAILQEASGDDATIERLQQKFEDFELFVKSHGK